MSSFSVCWNRRRLAWRRHSERAPWQLEAILCERMLLEGRPQLRIVARLAGILEDEITGWPLLAAALLPQCCPSPLLGQQLTITIGVYLSFRAWCWRPSTDVEAPHSQLQAATST